MLADVLADIGRSFVLKVQNKLNEKGLNATGETSRNITYKVDSSGLVVYAPRSILALVEGRKPSSKDEGGKLKERIALWVKAKGLPAEAVFPITRKIHEEGIKVPNAYNDGKFFDEIFTLELGNEVREKIKKWLF